MHIVFVIVEFAIVLGFMVLVHEFGHFAVAKLCGVRVETFSIGFGPRLFGWRHGDTDYRISILPLGGYVKMAGDAPGDPSRDSKADSKAMDVLGVDINPIDEAEFNARPRWQRVLIALSGPASNFVLSFFLLTLVAHYHHEVDKYLDGPAVVDYVPLNTPAARDGLAPGDTIVRFGGDANPTWDQILKDSALNVNHAVSFSYTHNGQLASRDLTISAGDGSNEPGPDMLPSTGLIPREQAEPLGVDTVTPGGPGDRAGLRPGDGVARIDALQIHSLDTLVSYLQDRRGAPATLLVMRHGQTLTMQLTPEKGDNGAGAIKYLIGFKATHVPVEVQKLPLGQSFVQSYKDNRDDSTLILRVLKGMFTRHVAVSSLSGPVGIAQQIDMATQMGIWTLLRLMSNISINLGIFNLLPLPILDGGMIVFLLIESIMRRDVNLVLKERIYQAAFVCFILFAVFVLFNDVTKLHLGH